MRTAAELTCAAVLIAALLIGCAAAPERYLSLEEDAELRAKCEGQNCVVVPASVLQQLLQQIRGMRGT